MTQSSLLGRGFLVSAGKRDWQFGTQGIDAIASASEEGEERSVIEKISARIDGLIK